MSLCSWFCGSLINRVNALQTQVAQLQSQLTAIQNSNVMALNSYITVLPNTTAPPTAPPMGTPNKVVFSGINVQIVNGLGQTDSINGLGNLIIGYDKPRPDPCTQPNQDCSIGGTAGWNYGDIDYSPTECAAAGGTMACNHKNGSHYLVVGDAHNYSQYGGVVFGLKNTCNGPWATVTGGYANHAGGVCATVSGGHEHLVDGLNASASGGCCSFVHGFAASVTGGSQNIADGSHASVTGGRGNQATGQYSHVCGGGGSVPSTNHAGSDLSVVLGGSNQRTTTPGQTIPSIP
jgi:hypothetical protein